MKTAIKVLNVLTIIGCLIGAVVLFINGCSTMNMLSDLGVSEVGDIIGPLYCVLAIVMVIPVIVCGIANSKLASARCKSDLTGIAIVTLILGNLISGILMLIINDADL